MPFRGSNVPFRGSNVPFGSAKKETMCSLAPPQIQHIQPLNYLNLKTVWALNNDTDTSYSCTILLEAIVQLACIKIDQQCL